MSEQVETHIDCPELMSDIATKQAGVKERAYLPVIRKELGFLTLRLFLQASPNESDERTSF